LLTPDILDHAVAIAPPGTQRLELPDADHHVMIDQPLALADMLAALVPIRSARTPGPG
jgi:pimeloyl-ACP methyl ester carboxylesterase